MIFLYDNVCQLYSSPIMCPSVSLVAYFLSILRPSPPEPEPVSLHTQSEPAASYTTLLTQHSLEPPT